MRKVALIEYGMGNLYSVTRALEYVNAEVVSTSSKDEIAACDCIVLPGVGAFNQAMERLASLGLDEILRNECLVKSKPILGICLGMQLLCASGIEGGKTAGLSFVPGDVVNFEFKSGPILKIPHVGFNSVFTVENSVLYAGLPKSVDFYFMHSYRVVSNEISRVGYCQYGDNFIASFEKDNIFGTQFHPEKSQKNGLMVLSNFLNYANA